MSYPQFGGDLLGSAIHTAVDNHRGQTDKGGRPYFLHVMAVMLMVTEFEDEELECIAILHDTIEDTALTYTMMKDLGFTSRVIEGVRAMTKQRGQTYDEYKKQVMANPDAIVVKMADLRHNSDITRLKGVTEKDLERVVKYCQFYSELKEKLTCNT